MELFLWCISVPGKVAVYIYTHYFCTIGHVGFEFEGGSHIFSMSVAGNQYANIVR